MKKRSKVVLIVLSALMLVGVSVFGTLAYLTSTDSVTNTFTVGNVAITLDEAKVDEYGVPQTPASRVDTNEYKLIPGHIYCKDPTIHVDADSEDCWVFARIENGLGTEAEFDIDTGKWLAVSGESNVYAYFEPVKAGDDITVFTQFVLDSSAVPDSSYASKTIEVTAYAIQADSLANYNVAWIALGL